MSFLPIYQSLIAIADLSALFPDNKAQIFEDVAKQDTKAPYIVWQALGGNAENHMDTPAIVDHVMYQLMIYDTDRQRAYKIRDAAIAALQDKSWILNPSINDFDSKTKLYMRGFDANWFLRR